MSKTNAIRIVESNNIKFTTISYEIDEDDLSGETVAKKLVLSYNHKARNYE